MSIGKDEINALFGAADDTSLGSAPISVSSDSSPSPPAARPVVGRSLSPASPMLPSPLVSPSPVLVATPSESCVESAATYVCDVCKVAIAESERVEHTDFHYAQQLQASVRADDRRRREEEEEGGVGVDDGVGSAGSESAGVDRGGDEDSDAGGDASVSSSCSASCSSSSSICSATSTLPPPSSTPLSSTSPTHGRHLSPSMPDTSAFLASASSMLCADLCMLCVEGVRAARACSLVTTAQQCDSFSSAPTAESCQELHGAALLAVIS